MSSLEPLIVGRWNGHSLWLQWAPADEAPDGYRVEIAMLEPVVREQKWKLIDKGCTKRAWMVLPIWRHGAFVQARVRVNGVDGDPEMAREAVFKRSTCVFAFQAGANKALVVEAGGMIHCAVDGAACSYKTDEWIEAAPNETVHATLSALVTSGWAQLDHEGHFDLRPGGGARIWNLEPSRNDVETTGRDYTSLEVLPRDGPFTVVKAPRNPNVR